MTEQYRRRPQPTRTRAIRPIRSLLFGALACLALTASAFASPFRGQVTFNGLPAPGAAVTATQGTKVVTAITDDQGLYSFPELADGTWTVAIQMTGFAPISQDVAIAPNAPPGSFALKLLTLDQIRAAAKPIKVDVTAPVVATSTAPVAGAPGAPAAAGTPAAPSAAKGAAPAKGSNTKAAPVLSAAAPPDNATAQSANDGYLVNGSVNNAATSQFSLAQAFGNTRNGRSLYNGGLSVVLDNSVFDAKQYSIAGLDSPKPAHDNFVAGITVGGPIKIPHLVLRQFNFFASYQRTQQSSNDVRQALVPTTAEENGNLTQLLSTTGQTIYAPASGLSAQCLASGVTPGAPFTGDIIPAACISSTAQSLLSFYPQPNVTGVSRNNFQAPLVTNTRGDGARLQLNKPVGTKDYLYGTFSIASNRSGSTSLFGFHDTTATFNTLFAATWQHRFSQRLFGTLGYNFTRSRNQRSSFFANRQDVSALAGISGNDRTPTYWGPPTLSFQQSGIYSLSDATSSNNRNETNALSFSLDWNRIRHNFSFGADFRRQETNVLAESNPEGGLAFTGTATNGGITGAGSDFADFLLGLPDTSTIAFGNADKYFRQSVYDAYAQDDFRVNPELSVKAGIRWEYGAPVTELKGRLVNLDPGANFTGATPVIANNLQTGQNYPSSLVRPDKAGFAPNIGIAWRPISGSSLLVRAGYSIDHDTSVYQSMANNMAQQSPLSTSLSIANSTVPACHFTIAAPFPTSPCAPTPSSQLIAPDQFSVDPNFRVAYLQTWTLSLQRDLPFSLQMVATYLGNKGTRGVQEFLPNTCPPVTGVTQPVCSTHALGYVYRTSNGNSTREAGSIQLRRRLRNGLTASVMYTFSKSLDDDYSFGGGGGTGVNAQVAQDWTNPRGQRGLSTFDQRHLLNASLQYTTGMGLGGHTLMSGWRGAAYKEWTVLTTINVGSGLPLTPTDPVAVPWTAYSGIIRANYLGGPVYGSSTPGVFLNSAAFGQPASGQWGNARRDSITGPDQFSLNASMARTFRLHGRFNLNARLDANNVLNHVTYTGWITSVGSPLFGTATLANQMRSMTVNLRLNF